MKITWLGNASFKIRTKDNKLIYIDPYADEYGYDEIADIVLVSTDSYDHSSRDKIKKVTGDETRIITTRTNSGLINGEFLDVGQIKDIDGIKIKGISGESNKYEDMLGFLILLEGRNVYFAGPTQTLPDIDKPVDLVFIPIGGTYVMNSKQASNAVQVLNPKIVIPMNYGMTVGSDDDAELFVEYCEHVLNSKIIVMKEGSSILI